MARLAAAAVARRLRDRRPPSHADSALRGVGVPHARSQRCVSPATRSSAAGALLAETEARAAHPRPAGRICAFGPSSRASAAHSALGARASRHAMSSHTCTTRGARGDYGEHRVERRDPVRLGRRHVKPRRDVAERAWADPAAARSCAAWSAGSSRCRRTARAARLVGRLISTARAPSTASMAARSVDGRWARDGA